MASRHLCLEGTIEATKDGDRVALFTGGDMAFMQKSLENRPVLKGNKMALDKETIERIANETWKTGDVVGMATVGEFAQAIYTLGVADERERAMQVCFTHSIHSEDLANICAEAIRKGE